MVQRKVLGQLGIQADHHIVKVPNLEASYLQKHQDGKNSRGTDLKKKMMKKKSGKIKHPEFENSRAHPRKPPSSPNKASSPSNSTPNYMKSTSSSDARKERSLVSSRTPQSVSSSNSKNLSITTFASSNTASLKHVKKSPSFKPARVCSSNKCSQRATCSSTLKDSKFPCYLELNPGGITSAMKVCPYTYCSLNGHHHIQFTPLKSFLSARRRSLKTQRSLKIGCLSPSPARPTGLSLDGDGPDQKQETEESTDFTIEIYCKEREETEQNHAPTSSLHEEVQENKDPFPVRDYSGAEESDMDWEGIVGSLNHNEEPDLEEHCSDMNSCEVVLDESSSDEIVAENMVQESFDDTGSIKSGACLSDEDTDSPISCPGPDFNICDHQPDTHSDDDDDDENETTQKHHHISDKLTEEEEICSVFHEKSIILQEGDEIPIQEYHQESTDLDENNTMPNMCGDIATMDGVFGENNLTHSVNKNNGDIYFLEKPGSESEEASEGGPIETSEDGSLKPPEKGCDQETYSVEKELSSNVETEKIAKVTENQNADIEVLPSLRKTSKHHSRQIQEEEEMRDFNPREPNFLPLKPDPEAERVDLKHQMIEERKNAEEWMIDYALQQAVSKLAPARRKKVALLVEAFETVSPIPKCEPHPRRGTKLFPPRRYIQACN